MQKTSWTHGKRRKGEGAGGALSSMTREDSVFAMHAQGMMQWEGSHAGPARRNAPSPAS